MYYIGDSYYGEGLRPLISSVFPGWNGINRAGTGKPRQLQHALVVPQ